MLNKKKARTYDNSRKNCRICQKIHENNNDGHGFDHVSRVVKLAKQILATEPLADSDLVIPAAYLHDIYDEKLCANVDKHKQDLAAFLTSLDFSKEKQDKIFYIIDNMSYSTNREKRTRHQWSNRPRCRPS